MRKAKRSSTSSSSRRAPRALAASRALGLLAACALGFALAFVAGNSEWAQGSVFIDHGPDSFEGPAPWKSYEIPEGDDWYLAYADYPIDHHVLYHGLLGTLEEMRAADVLILGTSVVPIGFQKEAIEAFERKTGLRVYNMGLGHAEKSAFFLDLIKRHALRPRYVVAVGFQTWSQFPSPMGREVAESSRWNSIKTVYEHTLSGWLRLGPVSALPHWSPPAHRKVLGFAVVRSRSAGSWSIIREKPVHWPVPDLGPEASPVDFEAIIPESLAAARSLHEGLARLGIELILTELPQPHWEEDRNQTAAIARELGVPFVTAASKGLFVRDDEHLEDESAAAFAPVLLDAIWEVIEGDRTPPPPNQATVPGSG